MIIRHVRLRNVKSYEAAEISFQPGINFVCGENGAGKTTIIEAIGFCLFGALPYKVSEFLRHGRGRGSVAVRFTARDGCDYTVIREFTAKQKMGVRVSDGDGQPVDLHNDADYEPWFRATAGLEPDMKPEDLFTKVIGISQNMFTAPFLQTPAKRKEDFDGLFRVASFRRAYIEAAAGVGELRDRIVQLDKEEALLAQRLEPLTGLRDSRRELAETTAALTAVHKTTLVALREDEAAVNRLHGLRDALTQAEVEAAATDSEVTALAGRLTRLQTDGERSRIAAERLTSLRPAHERWLALGAAAISAEARLFDFAQRESAFTAVDRELATLTVRVEQGQAELTRRQADLALERGALAAELASANARAETARVAQAATAEQLSALLGSQQALAAVGKTVREAGMTAVAATAAAMRISELAARRHELASALADREQIEAEAALEAGLRDEVASHQTALAQLRERHELLQRNRERAADGRCPFLDTACATVGAALAGRFEEELTELTTRAADRATLLALAEADAAAAALASQRLITLVSLADEHQRLGEALATARGDLAAALASMALLAEPARTLADQLDSLPDLPIGSDLGHTGDNRVVAVTACMAAAAAAAELATTPVIAAVTADTGAAEAASIAQRVVAAAEQAERLAAAALGSVASDLHQAMAEATATLEAAEALGATHTRRASELARQTEAADAEQSALAQLFAQRQTLASQQADLRRELLACGDPRAELGELRREQMVHAAAHEEYLRSEPEASRLCELQAEETTLRQHQAELVAKQTELHLRLTDLRRDFDPAALVASEQTVRNGHAQAAAQQQQLADFVTRADATDRQIAELEAVATEQATVSLRLTEHREALQLLEAARQVLNAAGEPVAEHFRAQVAADADRIQRRVSGEAATLVWERDYEVALVEGSGADARRRIFVQLSGGEQMTVALALRIALLRFLSPVRVGFFDEPTVNLDVNRRGNLAETLRTLASEVGQMILISHDDTFDAITQNVTYLRKCATGTTVGDGTP